MIDKTVSVFFVQADDSIRIGNDTLLRGSHWESEKYNLFSKLFLFLRFAQSVRSPFVDIVV